MSEMNEILGFGQRSAGDVEEMKVVALGPARGPFGDIRRNGIGRPANLADEPVDLFPRERPGHLVDSHREIIREFPRLNLRIIPHTSGSPVVP